MGKEELLIPEENKKPAGYIEGRPELFGTKLFEFRDINNLGASSVLVASRDPGSFNALMPVISLLRESDKFNVHMMVDGRAEELAKKKFSDLNDISDLSETSFGYASLVGKPDVILVAPSMSERGLDLSVSDPNNFPGSKVVMVEDNYGSVGKYLVRAREAGLPDPTKICVMDIGAKDLIIKDFPELEGTIEVTGQPAFDRFASEDTESIYRNVRAKLGVEDGQKLVSYMSTIEGTEKIAVVAKRLKEVQGDFTFIFRRHPRDSVSYDDYVKLFRDEGVDIINTNEFNSDEIGAASDVVITTWSTSGLEGIYRRKPVLYITDDRYFLEYQPPYVPVVLGAGAGINRIDDVVGILPQLLDANSDLNKRLMLGMEKNYLTDGSNAKRVVDVMIGCLGKEK